MDTLDIIVKAIRDLPKGDYEVGLNAITRHIRSAIAHFERDGARDADAFTDAIYRCNQAFEGGLKEAYRVLAGKDPAKVTPFQIESYLEENAIIRPRALKQLTRYREDYRNPSTHDYKLDFDEDEALLAILSVCGFTKLLVNQISSKVFYDLGERQKGLNLAKEFSDSRHFASSVAKLCCDALNTAPRSIFLGEVHYYLDGILDSVGLKTEIGPDSIPNDIDPDVDELGFTIEPWDNVATFVNFQVPIEIRNLRNAIISASLDWIKNKSLSSEEKEVILILYSDSITQRKFKYRLSALEGSLNLHVVYSDNLLEVLKDEGERALLKSLVD